MVAPIAYLVSAYLFGSIPIVLLLALRRGVDLRNAGTGNVGMGNLWQQVGVASGILGTLADLSKGLLPPVVAIIIGIDAWAAALSGSAAIAGQMWPIFTRFRGGRGNLTGVGATLGIAPLLALIGLTFPIAGTIYKQLSNRQARQEMGEDTLRFKGPQSKSVPLMSLFAYVVAPAAAWQLGYSSEVLLAVSVNAILVLVRRATAELSSDIRFEGASYASILRSRLLYDRQRP